MTDNRYSFKITYANSNTVGVINLATVSQVVAHLAETTGWHSLKTVMTSDQIEMGLMSAPVFGYNARGVITRVATIEVVAP